MQVSSWPSWTTSRPFTGWLRVRGWLPNQSTCVDLERAFNNSNGRRSVNVGFQYPRPIAAPSSYDWSRSLVRISGSKSGLFSVSSRFIIFMDRLSRHSQDLEGFWFGSHWISSLLFADDIALLVPSGRDRRDVLGVVCH